MGCIQMKMLAVGLICAVGVATMAQGDGTQPIVAIHDSELTRALEFMPLTNGPTGLGTTDKQWWTTNWHYFVMPESVKEALRSDGTAFTVVGDSNIMSGVLLTNDAPRYPILISLASEAIHDEEIAALTNYVAKGGFLLVGSSAFTRTTNGTSRGDFAFASALGLHMVCAGLTNWASNNTLTTTNQTNHILISHIPGGELTNRMPSSSEEISWGISPSHPFLAAHDIWQVQASGATVLAVGDDYPLLCVKPYGKGYFIYHAAFQPLIGHGGFAPGMYAYLIFRRAIEWAFESANLPIPKLSPWPYPYDAAFMVRHDLENYTDEIRNIATQTLEGHLRAILGTMTVEEIYQNRDTFASKVQEVAAGDMANMGLGIVSFTIRDIRDSQGYLDALGKPRIAQVKRDAQIAQAEADRDAMIKSSQATQAGQEAKFAADTKIAEAQRDYQSNVAQYQAAVNQKKAESEILAVGSPQGNPPASCIPPPPHAAASKTGS